MEGADQLLRRVEMDDRSHACRLPRSLRLRCVLPALFQCRWPDPAGGIGELRDNETHLIPRAMMALQGHIEFAVFGDDYDTPDGTAIRDYIHVTDLAAAHVAALKLLGTGRAGGSFNLGTGSGFSGREILTAIRQETGREISHPVQPRRAGDPTYFVADPSAVRKVWTSCRAIPTCRP